MNQPIVELRAFLRALSERRSYPSNIPRQLHVVAAKVLRAGEPDAVQDLVAGVLLDFLERDGQAGGIEALLALEDLALLGALRRRFTQVAAEQGGPAWRVQKQLRASVKQVLEKELPAVQAMPLSITVAGRVQTQLVAEAVAALIQFEAAPRDVKVLAGLIQDRYIPRAQQLEPGTQDNLVSDTDTETQVQKALDCPRNAEGLREALGPELQRVVAQRANGATLGQIAMDLGVATSTAHQRLGTGIARARSWAKASRVSPSSLERAIAQLGFQSGHSSGGASERIGALQP